MKQPTFPARVCIMNSLGSARESYKLQKMMNANIALFLNNPIGSYSKSSS